MPINHIQSKVTVLRCNPTRTDIVFLGFENGQIFFLRLSNKETYLFNAHPDSAKLKPKQEADPGMKIVEMAWDPNEDNLLVSFADKSLCLISYQGFNE